MRWQWRRAMSDTKRVDATYIKIKASGLTLRATCMKRESMDSLGSWLRALISPKVY